MVFKSEAIMSEKEALKIHGYYQSESESSSRGDSDEESLRFRPLPILIPESRLVKIRVDHSSETPLVSSSHYVNSNASSSQVPYDNVLPKPKPSEANLQVHTKSRNRNTNIRNANRLSSMPPIESQTFYSGKHMSTIQGIIYSGMGTASNGPTISANPSSTSFIRDNKSQLKSTNKMPKFDLPTTHTENAYSTTTTNNTTKYRAINVPPPISQQTSASSMSRLNPYVTGSNIAYTDSSSTIQQISAKSVNNMPQLNLPTTPTKTAYSATTTNNAPRYGAINVPIRQQTSASSMAQLNSYVTGRNIAYTDSSSNIQQITAKRPQLSKHTTSTNFAFKTNQYISRPQSPQSSEHASPVVYKAPNTNNIRIYNPTQVITQPPSIGPENAARFQYSRYAIPTDIENDLLDEEDNNYYCCCGIFKC